jgi:pimeloyl-ACP methyl ester carboxylesterase
MVEGNGSIIAALYQDPPSSPDAPAQTLPQAIPSGGLNLNAILYTAAGRGPHPTVLLLHGLPGNEQNVDLAQTMRRAGWNVLTIHYRGSWGGPGTFSFENCLSDAAAALDWMRKAAGDYVLRINTKRIVVIGHSMGGFVAAHVSASHSAVAGTVLISCVDLGRAFGSDEPGKDIVRVDENVGISAGLHILAGTSPGALAREARLHAQQWRLTNYADRLAGRSVLMVTANDGFKSGSDALAEAIQAKGLRHLRRRHFSTDHSYSSCRIALQTTVLSWITRNLLSEDVPLS